MTMLLEIKSMPHLGFYVLDSPGIPAREYIGWYREYTKKFQHKRIGGYNQHELSLNQTGEPGGTWGEFGGESWLGAVGNLGEGSIEGG